MPKDSSADMMQALVAKLYKTITGDNPEIKMPRNKFVTWMLPGLPFIPEDFMYCAKGLIGDSAEATRERYHQAWTLSKLFDYVPDVSNQFLDAEMQQTIFSSTQDTISSVYSDVLKYSKVVDMPLSDKETAKLEKFRNLLTVTKETVDIITDEKKQVTESGPIVLAYMTKMDDYLSAADEYMNLLIDAQAAKGEDPEAIRRVAAFANKSKFMRSKMEAAWMAWITQGYKNEYEQIASYIEQVTQKSMVLYKKELQQDFKNGLLTSPQEGTAGDFYYTTIVPGNFATSPGWTRFYFYEQDYENHFDKSTSQWSAGATANFGMLSFGARASGSKVEISQDKKLTNFRASFEFTQIPIVRPWFKPGFFSMRGWTLDQLWDLNYDKKVSDGGEGNADNKPDGRLVAYPTSALFVRNVVFTSDQSESHMDYVNSKISAGGVVGWGPFFIGGTYSHGTATYDFMAHAEGGAITIPGIQLIGFINNIIPKSPNPNPEIKPEQFVGGE